MLVATARAEVSHERGTCDGPALEPQGRDLRASVEPAPGVDQPGELAPAVWPVPNSDTGGNGPTYKDLAPLLGRRIRADIIREHWDEVVRLVASLKAGTVAPLAMLKRLAAYQRQNQLDLAIQELGRIERTLFMLDWLESPQLR